MLKLNLAVVIFFVYFSFAESSEEEIKGKYKLTSSDSKFGDYLKSIGVGGILRILTVGSTPNTEVTKNGEEWKIKTVTSFRTTNLKFTPGQEFKEITGDGRSCKSTIDFVNENKFVHTQRNCKRITAPVDTRELISTREFKDNKMILTLTTPNITSVRVYSKI